MRVNVVSETIQEFNGVRYYRCGHYFQRKGVRLHRVVWEHFNGPVPEGHHIHHKDENRANNQPENLECLPGASHISHHSKGKANWRCIEAGIEAAKVWHKSDEGREWHRQHYHDNCVDKLHERVAKTCPVCGTEFTAKKHGKFCHPNCKAKDFRRRHPGYSGRASGSG